MRNDVRQPSAGATRRTATRRRARRAPVALCLAALLAVLALTASAWAGASNNRTAVQNGVKFINKAKLSNFQYGFKADAIQALIAARKSGVKVKSKSITRLVTALQDDAASYATTAGAAGKVMLAAVAAGKNPTSFGSDAGGRINLYSTIDGFYSKGRYGDTAFDQAFAMLGLAAGHERVPAAAIKFVKKRRGKFGWGFSLSSGAGDDVESTAIIIQALRAAGVKSSDSALQSAYKWIRFQRNTDLGYNPDGNGGETNANATALVIEAGDALGKDTKDAERALRALQLKNGSFRLTPSTEATSKLLATMDPVLALAGRHYPVVKRSKRA